MQRIGSIWDRRAVRLAAAGAVALALAGPGTAALAGEDASNCHAKGNCPIARQTESGTGGSAGHETHEAKEKRTSSGLHSSVSDDVRLRMEIHTGNNYSR